MEVGQAMRERFSCRRFQPREVPRETITQILELAQHAPSWCNTQPWQLVVTRAAATESLRQALYAHAASGARGNPDFPFPARYVDEYRERRKVCGVQLYEALGIGREDRAASERQALENFRLFEAPHVVLITTDATLGVYGMLDCGLYMNAFMLAARSAGVDTIAQASLAAYPDLVRARFGLPERRRLVGGISFGFADHDHPANAYRTERAGLDAVVQWEEAPRAG